MQKKNLFEVSRVGFLFDTRSDGNKLFFVPWPNGGRRIGLRIYVRYCGFYIQVSGVWMKKKKLFDLLYFL